MKSSRGSYPLANVFQDWPIACRRGSVHQRTRFTPFDPVNKRSLIEEIPCKLLFVPTTFEELCQIKAGLTITTSLLSIAASFLLFAVHYLGQSLTTHYSIKQTFSKFDRIVCRGPMRRQSFQHLLLRRGTYYPTVFLG